MSEQAQKTVLIVDEDRDAADVLATLLRMKGYKALVAYDSIEGITLALNALPDFIFYDVGMPRVDGYEAARLLRRSEKFAKTVLVAVTPVDATVDGKRAQIAGFDVHLSKPLYFEEVKEVMSRPLQPK